MTNRQTLVLWAVVVGFSGFTAACGGSGPSLTTGPSPIPAPGQVQVDGASSELATSQIATIRVRCERRGTQRSRISVDGGNLRAGLYRARVTSAANAATSGLKSTVAGEVEFDFDSNPNDVAAGATRISPTFIQGGSVRGEIRSSTGILVAAATVACEVR
jgi:hypothetical protein